MLDWSGLGSKPVEAFAREGQNFVLDRRRNSSSFAHSEGSLAIENAVIIIPPQQACRITLVWGEVTLAALTD